MDVTQDGKQTTPQAATPSNDNPTLPSPTPTISSSTAAPTEQESQQELTSAATRTDESPQQNEPRQERPSPTGGDSSLEPQAKRRKVSEAPSTPTPTLSPSLVATEELPPSNVASPVAAPKVFQYEFEYQCYCGSLHPPSSPLFNPAPQQPDGKPEVLKVLIPAAPPSDISQLSPFIERADLRCRGCGKFFHTECLSNKFGVLPLPGDFGYEFDCKRCIAQQSNGNTAALERLEFTSKSWVEVLQVAFYNMRIDKSRQANMTAPIPEPYYIFKGDCFQFIEKHWTALCAGKQKGPTWQNSLSSTMSAHSDMFKREVSTVGAWSLISYDNPLIVRLAQYRAPPNPTVGSHAVLVTGGQASGRLVSTDRRGRRTAGSVASGKRVRRPKPDTEEGDEGDSGTKAKKRSRSEFHSGDILAGATNGAHQVPLRDEYIYEEEEGFEDDESAEVDDTRADPSFETSGTAQTTSRDAAAAGSSGTSVGKGRRTRMASNDMVTAPMGTTPTAPVVPPTAGYYGFAFASLYFRPNKALYEDVVLAPFNSSPSIFIDKTGRYARNPKGYCMARTSYPAVQGAWYFEVRPVPVTDPNERAQLMDNTHREWPPPHWRLGWALARADKEMPVGADTFGYSWQDMGKVFHNARGRLLGDLQQWTYSPKDVLGFYIELPSRRRERNTTIVNDSEASDEGIPGKGRIAFFKNGVLVGVAFEGLTGCVPPGEATSTSSSFVSNYDADFESEFGYYPAVSMYYNAAVEINFGPKFEYPPQFDAAANIPHPNMRPAIYLNEAYWRWRQRNYPNEAVDETAPGAPVEIPPQPPVQTPAQPSTQPPAQPPVQEPSQVATTEPNQPVEPVDTKNGDSSAPTSTEVKPSAGENSEDKTSQMDVDSQAQV